MLYGSAARDRKAALSTIIAVLSKTNGLCCATVPAKLSLTPLNALGEDARQLRRHGCTLLPALDRHQ